MRGLLRLAPFTAPKAPSEPPNRELLVGSSWHVAAFHCVCRVSEGLGVAELRGLGHRLDCYMGLDPQVSSFPAGGNPQVSLQRPGAWGPAQPPRQRARAQLVGLRCAWLQALAGSVVREGHGRGSPRPEVRPRVRSHVGISRSGHSVHSWRRRPLTSVPVLTWAQRHLRGAARPPGWGSLGPGSAGWGLGTKSF